MNFCGVLNKKREVFELEIQNKRPLHLFEGFGIEMEYIIVDSSTLDVLPVSDEILKMAAGKIVTEHLRNGMAWSNELVLHLIEIKTNGPAAELNGTAESFQHEIRELEKILAGFNARFMPGAAHPWMNPFKEVRLWPHEFNPVYEAYNRIFDCRGHGWANLQSTHLNLPFHGDEEFEKLHAAVRLVLPLIPALAASSPIADGKKQSWLDFRMEKYRTNSVKIPSVTGKIIPEAVFSHAEYQDKIFDKMYRDIAPFDPDGILQDEWLNSRGAMARWDRKTIEIRVIDIQEYPAADLAILEWIVNLTKALVDNKWASLDDQKKWTDHSLYDILMPVIKYGEQAVISNPEYISLFGLNETGILAGKLCRHIFQSLKPDYSFSKNSADHLELIFKEGTLARRILKALPKKFEHCHLFNVYTTLCDCLRHETPFLP